MTRYALNVNYSDRDVDHVDIGEHDPTSAEAARQGLLRQIEEARELHAPVIFSDATDDNPEAGTPIDPAQVTSVDLVEAD